MNRDRLSKTGTPEKLPWAFFGLVFVMTIPLWLVGDRPLPLPVNLPLSALSAFIPALAALVIAYRQRGRDGAKALLKKAVDFHRIRGKGWYLPALLLPPLLYGLSYLIMRLAGLPLPAPVIPLLTAPAFFAVYYLTGAGEELGWTGYALEPLQARWGVVRAGLLLGVIWALWHSIAFVQTHNPAGWIFWQSIKTVAMRLVLVWLYYRSGKSVSAAILFHTTDNVSWSLFPNFGSHYSPMVTGLLTVLMALIVLVEARAKPAPSTTRAAQRGR